MTALKDRIAALISATGPLSVADYMALCLLDPQHGYYTTREPFGAAGDFTTAPEISQMFGELVGVWMVLAWEAAGRPSPVTLVEIGPGRGTLMKDALRALKRTAPPLAEAARVILVDASPRLVEVQRKTLCGQAERISWVDSLAELPPQPLLIVANELFDALPVRQFVQTASGWRERMVGLDEAGGLRWITGSAVPDEMLLPSEARGAGAGAVVELAPARAALMQELAERLAACGGAGLVIDYGYATPALGDTLQALRRHAPDGVLNHPGEADLTAHVDFAALSAMAYAAGLSVRLRTQGEFLLGLGLLERAGRLGAAGDDALRTRLSGEVERIAGPDQMGTLFKALEIGAALPLV